MQQETPTTLYHELEIRLNNLRDKMSYAEIARKIGKSHAYIRSMMKSLAENPDSKPGYETLLRLVQLMNDYGIPWEPAEAMLLAGYPQPLYQPVDLPPVPLDRPLEAQLSLRVPVYDAPVASREGIGFRSKSSWLDFTNSMRAFESVYRSSEPTIIVIDTAAEVKDRHTVLARWNGQICYGIAERFRTWTPPGQILGKVLYFVQQEVDPYEDEDYFLEDEEAGN